MVDVFLEKHKICLFFFLLDQKWFGEKSGREKIESKKEKHT